MTNKRGPKPKNLDQCQKQKELLTPKKRKLSCEVLSGDEFDTQTSYCIEQKLTSTKYNAQFVKFFANAKDFNLKYFQENGFTRPLVFTDKAGLGLRVPSENFKVSDVKACVGSKRIVDVVDVSTQQGLTMSMKEWCAYYESEVRDRLLNVISLEFSHTKLENYVEAPQVVRQVDWIDTAWPQFLRDEQTESTNSMDLMKYPKVQKYVLMSVAGCYTDFHIDMGGTSVWYHVLKGSKTFWLIPPTDKNLKLYEKWTLSGEQNKIFLPDLVDECQRIDLQPGWTFMLPSGWIHGVYTKHDSLVFGGNFLHSFNIPMQIKVFNIESKTRVPLQHRYPFFHEIMWFAIERYIHCLTGITHLIEYELEHPGTEARRTFQPDKTIQHLTQYEIDGLQAAYEFIKLIPFNKRQVPKEIVEAEKLLDSLEQLLKTYLTGNGELAITGEPIAHWPKPDKEVLKQEKRRASKQVKSEGGAKTGRKHNMRDIPRTRGSIKKRLRPQNIPRSKVERRRRVRCHRCEPCTRSDCGECKYCKDMKKFGGSGISKQCCLSKQCLAPLLPTTSVCMLCNEQINRKNKNPTNLMYECEICFEIYHFECYTRQYSHLNDIESIVNEDLENCWTCSNCISKGFLEKLEQEKHTKRESEVVKTQNIKREQITFGDDNDDLSLDSLTQKEKRIILTEFCELFHEEDRLRLKIEEAEHVKNEEVDSTLGDCSMSCNDISSETIDIDAISETTTLSSSKTSIKSSQNTNQIGTHKILSVM